MPRDKRTLSSAATPPGPDERPGSAGIGLPAWGRRLGVRIVRFDLAGRASVLRYALAILCVGAATAMRLVLPLDSAPFLVYLPGVLVVAFLLGRGPGLLASCLSVLAAIWVLEVHNRLAMFSQGHILGDVFYLGITLALVIVCDTLRLSLQQRQADILALKVAYETQLHSQNQLKLLNHELSHRLKNMLAMIQAIANQTLRRAASLPEAQAAFEARLIALGAAQDVLVGQSWEKASLRQVVDNALAPHTDTPERFHVEGPELRLSSRCALALSLAIHELATNAAKYGALSVESGRVDVTWSVTGRDPSAQLAFIWAERNGPPVTIPSRTGFGSMMIERSLSGYFKGKAEISYLPQGVQMAITAPVTYDEAAFVAGKAEIQVCS